jgi:hypothetical protein
MFLRKEYERVPYQTTQQTHSRVNITQGGTEARSGSDDPDMMYNLPESEVPQGFRTTILRAGSHVYQTRLLTARAQYWAPYVLRSHRRVIRGHKRMVRFQNLLKNLFLMLQGHNTHCQQRELSMCLMRYQLFTSHAYCGAEGPVPKMWADCVDNVGSSPFHNPIGFHGLLWGYLYLAQNQSMFTFMFIELKNVSDETFKRNWNVF